jgi:hypothetical protein
MGSTKNSGKDFYIYGGRFYNNGSFVSSKSVIIDKTSDKNGVSGNVKVSVLSNNYYIFCATKFDSNNIYWKVLKNDLSDSTTL